MAKLKYKVNNEWVEINVVGAQGNSVTNAEILNNNLIIHIGVLQPDGTILDTPINVGRVVGQDGAQGQHGDGYTASQINSDGDLIVTEVVYSGDNYTTRQVNLGHVVGAPGAPGTSVTGATINNQGHLILTLSDGTTIDAGYVGTPKTDITGAVITLSQSAYTYDGTSKAPTVSSVTLNGQALTAGTDYAVVANPATNAGQYVVTVSGIGDYTGTETVNWTINKAQATISGDDSITISGLDEPVSKTYTTDGDGSFSFTISGNIATINNSGGIVTITPTAYGTADLTVTVAEGQNYLGTIKTVPITVEEVQTATVFGVVWDYSLSSPKLARLTQQTDPRGVVTNIPSQEPTSCVGNDGNGQSDFDNYMPWAGMQRYNYVDGQVVDFVDYNNGETFVYIPEFWSKIVDDTANSKMYFYIASAELTGFTRHQGSGRYIGRYQCDVDFLSKPNGAPKSGVNLAGFRSGITSVDGNHFQYDFHSYNALLMLYIVEFANLDSQSAIGAGITSGTTQTLGQTDILTYHTGRAGGTDNTSAVQYRWIENLWGNIWEYSDGILIDDYKIFLCGDPSKYASTVTNDYAGTGIVVTDTSLIKYIMREYSYQNGYLFPKLIGGTSTTYVCDAYFHGSGLKCLMVGGRSTSGADAGLFFWNGDTAPDTVSQNVSSRPILIINGGTA